ncbi:MAG TPA: hypothetical protein VEB64_14575 [Azospirillaceae bacterium]|nr:hypothetical protein [Azospirillaceae bacterium]
MSQSAFIIEVHGNAAGIVVRDGSGFRFFASHHQFQALEGRVFGTPHKAERAALTLAQARLH